LSIISSMAASHLRHHAGQALRQPAGHELTEGDVGGVVVGRPALDEVHRHVERPLDVGLEAEAGLEGARQHAGAVAVGVAPDLRAGRQEAGGPAVEEGRGGEEGGGERLQRQADAQLGGHVGFRREVEVHLHRRGAEHHVETARADLGHVGAHDGVARLGHHRGLEKRPLGRGAEAGEGEAERLCDGADVGDMGLELALGGVDVAERRAGEFELAAGLEADGAAAVVVGEPDDRFAVEDRLPAAAGAQALEQGADSGVAVVGDGGEIGAAEGELLVLGAEFPGLARARARLDPGDEGISALDRTVVGGVARHVASSICLRGAHHTRASMTEQMRFVERRVQHRSPIRRKRSAIDLTPKRFGSIIRWSAQREIPPWIPWN
jgi:hypothetical protein